MKKKVNVWTVVLCVSLLLLLVLALVSDAMSVGDKLASVNIYLAGALEDINMEDLVSKATESTFGKALGLVSASAVQGTVNALTTLRIGVITKNYLLNADVSMTRKELRKKSYTEAFGILQNILKQNFGEKVDKVKDPVKRFFGRRKNEPELLTGE